MQLYEKAFTMQTAGNSTDKKWPNKKYIKLYNMTDEDFTKEQMAAQRKEVSRLRSELKAFNKARAQMSKEEKE